MVTLLSSDKPVSTAGDDKFQRYNFAKGIADLIKTRKDESCIVIGVFGAWGEGKTSVINFIETETRTDKEIVTIKFNPWRYNSENALLIHFFQTLSKTLDTDLKTKKEKLGDQIMKYAKVVSIDIPGVGNVGEGLDAVGKLLGEVDVEELKRRIEAILKKISKRIVIFIDDIDRLDKNEIFSIFRLVKLTADFANTIYVLSFDDVMVSAALGERFGEGNQSAGQNFLEKIIQVPLRIPLAQPSALQSFCFDIINKSLETNRISLTDEEGKSFGNEFNYNILGMLTTPRLAVRYGNTLSFSMPLLQGEVNMVDLMLIEAVKIFYPKFYDLIKAFPEYFIGSYSNSYSGERDSTKMKAVKELLDKTGADLTTKQQSAIKNLLQRLFPNLKEPLQNYVHNRETAEDLFKYQKIGSPKYFNRYFSYTVIKGEISDIAFSNFLSAIEHQSSSEVLQKIQELIQESSVDTFLIKLRSLAEDIPWTSFYKLSLAIASGSEIFPKPKGFVLSFMSANGQVLSFLAKTIKQHGNKPDQLQLIQDLMYQSKPLEFATDLVYDIERKENAADPDFLDRKEKAQIATILIERAKSESSPMSIFEKFPLQTPFLFNEWAKIKKPQMNKYVRSFLNSDYKKSMDLLRAFTPTMFSSAVEHPFKSNFTKEDFVFFTNLFDKDYVKKLLERVFAPKLLSKKEVIWSDRGDNIQTDINIVRQFMHWYHLKDPVGALA